MRTTPALFPIDIRTLYANRNSSSPFKDVKLGTDEWYRQNIKKAKTAEEVSTIAQRWLEQYCGYTPDQAFYQIAQIHRLIVVDSDDNLRSALFQTYFLEQPREGTFGEFLDEQWENIHKRILNYDIPYHKHTHAIFRGHAYYRYALIYRQRGLKQARDKIESLTQDDFNSLLSVPPSRLKASPSVVSGVIDSALAQQRGEIVKNPSLDHLRNILFRAFAKSVAATSGTVGYSFDILSVHASQLTHSIGKVAYENPIFEKATQISSKDAMKFALYLDEHAEQLGVQKIFVLLSLLNEPALFGRGPKKKLREFLVRLTEKSNSLELFDALANLAVYYTGPLPTGNEWLNSLKQEINPVGSGELLAEYVTTDTSEREPRKLQIMLKNVLGKN